MYKKNWIKSAFKQKYNSKLWFKKNRKMKQIFCEHIISHTLTTVHCNIRQNVIIM